MGIDSNKHCCNNWEPIYFNIHEVPEEWRKEAQVLLSDRTIRGDGKTLMSIRKSDLLAEILKRRIENNK
ncbi:hypothetical protein [Intestinibacillus massiliensis]